ncbi:TonB-dependent receptor [Compostibacter hankyongensis]|uniref:TonB-dependent receptor n=1 Tax=Compostibacter hankyongensis TaxID=1007089 RepID=A0ABP8FZA1_9BACT
MLNICRSHAAAQETRFSFSFREASLEQVLHYIERSSSYSFMYKSSLIEKAGKITLSVRDAPIDQVLDLLFKDRGLRYTLQGNQIILSPKRMFLPVTTPASPPADTTITVSGRIKEAESGMPMPGVTIVERGTHNGTTSDANGAFSLRAGPHSTLVISFIGYQTKAVPASGSGPLTVMLQPSASDLNEVVVVGYGQQQKSNITSAISEINTSKLKDLPAPTSGQLLLGRSSGVSVNENSGAPGSPPSIQIHGISSINAGIEPLVVIDGFPVGNGIPQSLNPNDIEKITILKDAASTSIYGARGSNGVILIQTTHAAAEHATIEYNTYAGFQYVPHGWRPKVLNALEYAGYNKERIEETDAANHTTTPIPKVFQDVLDNPDKLGKGTDWLDAFLREGKDAYFQNHSLTFSAGNKNLKGVMSGGYLSQKGVLPNTDFKRYSLRTNLEGTFTDWFHAGAHLAVARTEDNSLPVTDMWGVMMQAVVASPLQSPYDEEGRLVPYLPADAPGYFAFPNPLYRADVVRNNTVGRDVHAAMNVDIEIIKGLHYKPQVYTRLFTQEVNTFIPTTLGKPAIGSAADLSPAAPPFVNSATNQKFDITNWGVDNLLSYDRQIGPHALSALLGYTVQKQTGELSQITASGFPADDHLNYLEASEVSAQVSDYTNWSLLAFFGRLNYNYKGKYLAELNFRREGSSKFGLNNKYGNFPSGSLGWRISEERFYPRNFWINELKLRASYGITGNSAIGDFDRFGTVVSIPNLSNLDNNFNYVLGNAVTVGKALTSLGNQDLKWETARQLDIGLSLGILKGRIAVQADYYRKVTEDMLFDVSLPLASGFSSTRTNVGKMLNYGWDFEVSSVTTAGKFTWNSNLNLSLLNNKVTDMPDQIKKIISDYNTTEEGAAVGSLYGYVLEGIFNTEKQVNDPDLFGWPGAKSLGAFIYKDVNGDKKIDAQDKTIIGNPHPHVMLGFNNTFAYKNFSLSVLATGAFGYQIVSELNEWLYNEKGRWNVSTRFLNRWRSPEDPGDGLIPALNYPGQHNASDDWVESGNHVWIKNITLGYTLPQEMLERTGYISGLRFYMSVQNAFRFTRFSGWNPQVSTRGGDNPQTLGIDNFSYPVARTYTVGAAISF